ncbi:hypothetical protein VTP01DRAFT_8348, partial [Rhizomucor pusillus]|uniref:uncharacterized protein n=1 Tax=Rhizomucor pusillus TaxID=4840 RepID=UPI003743FF62
MAVRDFSIVKPIMKLCPIAFAIVALAASLSEAAPAVPPAEKRGFFLKRDLLGLGNLDILPVENKAPSAFRKRQVPPVPQPPAVPPTPEVPPTPPTPDVPAAPDVPATPPAPEAPQPLAPAPAPAPAPPAPAPAPPAPAPPASGDGGGGLPIVGSLLCNLGLCLEENDPNAPAQDNQEQLLKRQYNGDWVNCEHGPYEDSDYCDEITLKKRQNLPSLPLPEIPIPELPPLPELPVPNIPSDIANGAGMKKRQYFPGNGWNGDHIDCEDGPYEDSDYCDEITKKKRDFLPDLPDLGDIEELPEDLGDGLGLGDLLDGITMKKRQDFPGDGWNGDYIDCEHGPYEDSDYCDEITLKKRGLLPNLPLPLDKLPLGGLLGGITKYSQSGEKQTVQKRQEFPDFPDGDFIDCEHGPYEDSDYCDEITLKKRQAPAPPSIPDGDDDICEHGPYEDSDYCDEITLQKRQDHHPSTKELCEHDCEYN